MSKRISQQQLESYLWGAAVLLRGTIDAGDYKQFIFPLLFYKRLCDVFDEETDAALAESGGDLEFASYPENHRFQIPREAHWNYTRQSSGNVGMAIQAAMRSIEKANPETLYGIFGDAQWTNKERLSDAMLRDLIEHFSTLDLSIANLPEDELGQGYEYLIKKFADDSGHTAAEFYTNRTVVHLMTEMLEPQPGESVYDPTCGSGGMLLSCIAHLRRQGQEWRNVRLFGQERNLMTSSIARMNCFLHGIEDFQIVRGDTLSDPKFVEGDRLRRFDLVLANPPYSIKQWDRDAFASDRWGRNLFGTPPQGRADYAFWQHIICSLASKTGRCAILFPHGVLFRQEESEMRQKMIQADLIECVLGLGPNLFYNSPMEACVVICRTSKSKARKGKVLFINAVNEVTRERAQSFLTDENISRIVGAFRAFQDDPGFARVASIRDVQSRSHTLAIPLYVDAAGETENSGTSGHGGAVKSAVVGFLQSRRNLDVALAKVLTPAEDSNGVARVAATSSCSLLSNRHGWRRVRFGEVVQNVNTTESDPASAGLERYIGLEHLDPGSLHIRRWGNVSNGTTFTRRCRPGQVLFGKRRAYQRKVAVAECDAVVSGDIYVLEPKDDGLIPELMPFICLSERFFRHAVGTSAGSLSPRTNWDSLASFELDLPPRTQQQQIADMLWAADRSLQAAIEQQRCLADLKRSVMERRTSGDGACVHKLLDQVATFQYGLSCSLSDKGEYPVLRMMNYDEELVVASDLKYVDMPAEVAEAYLVNEGDILFNRTNSADLVGKVGIFKLDGPFLFASYLVRIKTDRSVLVPEYLNYFLNSDKGQSTVRAFATPGVSQSNISAGSLKKVQVPIPSLKIQQQVIEELSHIATAGRVAREHVQVLSAVLIEMTNAFTEAGNVQ